MVGQGLTVLAVGAGGGWSDFFFFRLSFFFSFSLFLEWMDGQLVVLSPFRQNLSDIRMMGG